MNFADLPLWKRLVVAAMAVLAVAGVYDAMSNLPVVTGCTFYDNCPADLPADPVENP